MPSCSPRLYSPLLAKKTTLSSGLHQTGTTFTARLALRTQHLALSFRLRPHSCLQTSASTSPRRGCSLSSPRSSTSLTQSNPCKHHNLLYTVLPLPPAYVRHASSSSSSKWLSRQSSDPYTKHAKLQNLKSRAAFKLLQINERYHLFRPGMTVVDLGFAPGSWSQVAIDLVRPGLGRVVGVDVIPVQPPKGVNGIQGDFLSPEVQARVSEFLRDEDRGLMRRTIGEDTDAAQVEESGYLDRERAATTDTGDGIDVKEHQNKCVDLVLSDMMMNTTGNKFRDHAGSMDLCRSALYFSYETLKVGGHFVCKFYQGTEDKKFEKQLKAMFHKVHREKPESSRSESRESFFVALKRLAKVEREKVFDEG